FLSFGEHRRHESAHEDGMEIRGWYPVHISSSTQVARCLDEYLCPDLCLAETPDVRIATIVRH
ncbi:MAG TPA: hypothetical protein VFS39_02895, partial [Nitrospira sp.]|nr:hypothetical protein [Nitrospira sp.]